MALERRGGGGEQNVCGGSFRTTSQVLSMSRTSVAKYTFVGPRSACHLAGNSLSGHYF